MLPKDKLDIIETASADKGYDYIFKSKWNKTNYRYP